MANFDRVTSSGWITARRLRAHAAVLAVCLWSVYVWNLATPGMHDRSGNFKGTDFLHFYTLGLVAAEHRGTELYDMRAQTALAAERIPEALGIRYLPLYPPQVSILFAPFAQFSYPWALAVWWTGCGIIYGICCFFAWRTCPHLLAYPATVALAAIGFPAFFHLIAWGQTSALALAIFTAGFFLLRTKREFLAGLVFGCLIFKPQLGIAAGIVSLISGAWSFVAAALVSAAAQLLIGALYYGREPLLDWLRALWSVQNALPWLEPRLYQTHSLRTFWAMLVPSANVALALYVASALGVMGITAVVWKRQALPFSLRYSCLLLATVLISPHLTVYDLVILAPALLLTSEWLIANRRQAGSGSLGTLLYLVYVLPLVGPVSRWTHIQFSVVAMTATVYVIWRISEDAGAAARKQETVALGSEQSL